MTATGWRPEALAREGVLNALFAGARTWLILAFALLAGSGQVAFHSLEWRQLQSQIEAAEAAGRNVLVVTGDPEAPAAIDVASCEALSEVSGVRAAGVLVPQSRTWIDQAGMALLTIQASPTLVPELGAAEAVLGSEIPSTPATLITGLGDGPRRAVAAAPRPTGIDINSALVVPRPSGMLHTSECIVELDRFAQHATMTPLLVASLTTDGQPLVARATPQPVEPAETYATRLGRFVPLVIGVIGALLGLVTLRARGSEVAAYRLSGTSVRDTYRILLLEQATHAGILCAGATIASLVLAPHLGTVVAAIAWGGASALVWMLLFALGSWSIAARDPISLAKDR